MQTRSFRLSRIVEFARDRRASIALLMAALLPMLMGSLALAVEIGSWSVTKIELQRRADLAAFAAMGAYQNNATQQASAGTGADMAALNGAAAASRNWSGSTLTSSDVTVSFVNGVRTSTNQGIMVVATKTVPLTIGQFLTTSKTITLSATAWSELNITTTTTGGGGGQPCMVALKSNGTGVTVTGGTTLSAPGCSVRSNAAVSVTNGSKISVTNGWVYANGTATVSGGSSITDGTHTVTPTNINTWNNSEPLNKSAGSIDDPYASDTDITSKFSSLHPGTGTAFTGTWQPSTLNPGTYSSITSGSGNITLNPGLYVVNGNINVGNGAAFSGTGVTIVTSGTVTFGGGSVVTLSAPLAQSTSGGIPGVLMAGNGTGTDTLSNGVQPTLNGLVYFPNGTMALAGGVKTSNSCLEVLAGSITVSNGATLGSSCDNYGTKTFDSLPSTTTTTRSASLVQ